MYQDRHHKHTQKRHHKHPHKHQHNHQHKHKHQDKRHHKHQQKRHHKHPHHDKHQHNHQHQDKHQDKRHLPTVSLSNSSSSSSAFPISSHFRKWDLHNLKKSPWNYGIVKSNCFLERWRKWENTSRHIVWPDLTCSLPMWIFRQSSYLKSFSHWLHLKVFSEENVSQYPDVCKFLQNIVFHLCNTGECEAQNIQTDCVTSDIMPLLVLEMS